MYHRKAETPLTKPYHSVTNLCLVTGTHVPCRLYNQRLCLTRVVFAIKVVFDHTKQSPTDNPVPGQDFAINV